MGDQRYEVVSEGGKFVLKGPAGIYIEDKDFDDLLTRATRTIDPRRYNHDQMREAFDQAAKKYHIGVIA